MPYERIENIRYAVDYLTTLPFVDEHAIGALGICAAGGYVINAAQTERRISAVVGVSAADIGAANRNGWLNNRTIEQQIKLGNNAQKRLAAHHTSVSICARSLMNQRRHPS